MDHPVEVVVAVLFAALAFWFAFAAQATSGCATVMSTFAIDGILSLVIALLIAVDEMTAAEIVAAVAIVAFFAGILGAAFGRLPC